MSEELIDLIVDTFVGTLTWVSAAWQSLHEDD